MSEQITNTLQQLSLQSNSSITEKPTQVVSPAVKHSTPKSSNTTPKAFVSPAVAALDRILTLGGVTPVPPPPTTDMDPHVVEQLRAVKELLNAQEEESDKLREQNKILQDRLQESETRIEKLKEQSEEFAEKEKALESRVAENARNNRQMSVVMEEYERTISTLIGEREAEQARWAEEREMLTRDRDHAAQHLASMEHSFNDVHAKYERCKQVIQGYKSNEETLRKNIAESDETIAKLETRYETLRRHAMQQLNKANQELELAKKAHDAEITKLNAMLKRSELHAASLQESLAQKIKDNEELTAICDELINKVS